jgi:hypothetical protein
LIILSIWELFLTRDAYCTREIKTRIIMAKKHPTENITLGKQIKHLTQKEISQILYLEYFTV